MNMDANIIIPEWFYEIAYNYDINPENPSDDLLETGSNCQIFSYELLKLNGKEVPYLWSDQMWNDREYSQPVENEDFLPLDLLFFNRTPKLRSAHVGVYLGNNEVIHNSKKIGKPIVWKLNEFAETERYKFLIGGKRFIDVKNV
jgi:hypothetical protein